MPVRGNRPMFVASATVDCQGRRIRLIRLRWKEATRCCTHGIPKHSRLWRSQVQSPKIEPAKRSRPSRCGGTARNHPPFSQAGMLVHKPISITMRTPGQDQELAIGFLYTEGILHRRSAIEAIGRGPDSSISVTVAGDLDLGRLERHFYTSSSCGVCGKTSLQALRMNREIRLDPSRPKHSVEFLLQTPSLVREKQSIFEHTGGLHAAALFDQEQNLVRICEDIGRHNAVDKLVGSELLAGRSDFSDLLLFVSGRAGFELVQKSIMTGIPFMAAVGAPSSLSVELARQYGSTLHWIFARKSI